MGRGRRRARQSARGCSIGFTQWGIDDELAVIRVDADPDEPESSRGRRPRSSATPTPSCAGWSTPCRRRQTSLPPGRNGGAAGQDAQAHLDKLAPQIGFLEAIRAELPEDGIFVDEVTQIGFAARLLLPVYRPRTFLSPGYQDNLGWGYATALGAQHARPRRTGAFDLGRRRLPVHLERDSPPPCATAFRSPSSCSTTALSATCAASRRSTTATG